MSRDHSVAAALVAILAGCTSPVPVDDPPATLSNPYVSPRQQLGAMVALDADPQDPVYLDQLAQIIWRPGYTVDIRQQAFDRLVRYDEERLRTTIRQRLPRLTGIRAWQEQLCVQIADRGWVDLSPALVSSWANRVGFVDDLDRVEYKTLVRLHGEEHVIDVVFELLVESNRPHQQGLRGRCWQLLNRLGYRERLVAMLEEQVIDPSDAMLIDLRTAAGELGVVPRTREEILWVRKLREPQRAEFWSQAAAVVPGLSEARRAELELRDIPIVVAASIHEPWLLEASNEELFAAVRASVRASRIHVDPDRFEGFPGSYRQRLTEHRAVLTWGDLAAMLLAVRAAEVPQVAAHLFDYAERDRVDTSCEYGGVIRLDERGRFEILEFPPRFRRRDNEFIASQMMLDAAYTSVFQFHNHAQRYRNGRFAGPGIGDLNYADDVRANCLVFTFINEDTLNMDFYRHGRVIVDLGEVKRP